MEKKLLNTICIINDGFPLSLAASLIQPEVCSVSEQVTFKFIFVKMSTSSASACGTTYLQVSFANDVDFLLPTTLLGRSQVTCQYIGLFPSLLPDCMCQSVEQCLSSSDSCRLAGHTSIGLAWKETVSPDGAGSWDLRGSLSKISMVSAFHCPGTSLVVQWLRRHAPNAGGSGSIPGQGTGSHVPQLRPGTAKKTNNTFHGPNPTGRYQI